ncbi:phytanoyl-CoA dioxygenase family protein [Gilvimarinus sp. SDUM040013]|uniref:Phytanoyl-CoA dioxygenase family protein n=1 Tax=Gilvimarinus gilvus TaxID=3058038 RepID=A0ABU4RYT1_9GAMM|nr:phytanoyl-CoA dioxygenase family protein [Gilvimarinus sp. SDUM040013]MDO3386315.1 phytanoyl-CoA dioxygenase family protein [Gilvimarinus sp. SDUM040013]MDX6850027.1 phytanoyl-CoA dioxygenase family protein [Gilvimarinus sp. SDUM040013]
MLRAFNNTGFELITNLVSAEDIQALRGETDVALKNNKGGGIRTAERKLESVRALVASAPLLQCVSQYLAGKPKFVRAIVFDKTPEKNWLVAWHQDKTVAVTQRFECEGWGPWSVKDGVHHVQPPIAVLEQMVSLRIHLDDATVANGCLKVIPNSHCEGLLPQRKIDEIARASEAKFIEAPKGSTLIMRPHLLHASSKAKSPDRRRVLHLEFCSYLLPPGIHWA